MMMMPMPALGPAFGTRAANNVGDLARKVKSSTTHAPYTSALLGTDNPTSVENNPKGTKITATSTSKSSKRLCHFPGCQRTIKSQRHCQKHGAVVKKCKVENCAKQAQGRHEGMCKRHWNEKYKAPKVTNNNGGQRGASNKNSLKNGMVSNESVQNFKSGDDKSPANVSGEEYFDKDSGRVSQQKQTQQWTEDETQKQTTPQEVQLTMQQQEAQQDLGSSVYDKIIPRSVLWKSGDAEKAKGGKSTEDSSASSSCTMPLVEFLREGANSEAGWHRKQERSARNFKPLSSVSEQLQPEEKQLILFETMLITGTTYANHQRTTKDLAHAWGRERGFHTQLVHQMCARRGDLSRKRRSDVGKVVSEEDKARMKRKREENSMKLSSESKGKMKQQQDSKQPQQELHRDLEPRVTVATHQNSVQVHRQAASFDEMSRVDNTRPQYYSDSQTPVYFSQSDSR